MCSIETELIKSGDRFIGEVHALLAAHAPDLNADLVKENAISKAHIKIMQERGC